MEVGGVTETVLVTGTSPAIDITTATIGSVLDTDALRSLPVGRTFAQAVYLTPGVSNSGTVGTANPSIWAGPALKISTSWMAPT